MNSSEASSRASVATNTVHKAVAVILSILSILSICFFAVAILFFTIPPLAMAGWKWLRGDPDEHLPFVMSYLAWIAGLATCAFAAGLLLALRRPFLALGLFVALLVVVARTLPDR